MDVVLPRPLTLAELVTLATIVQGTCRVFGTLVWMDLPQGRLVASTVAPRLTLRLRRGQDVVLSYLQTLPTETSVGDLAPAALAASSVSPGNSVL